jgi:hypothetical protein
MTPRVADLVIVKFGNVSYLVITTFLWTNIFKINKNF